MVSVLLRLLYIDRFMIVVLLRGRDFCAVKDLCLHLLLDVNFLYIVFGGDMFQNSPSLSQRK